jgi:hypothetical protein
VRYLALVHADERRSAELGEEERRAIDDRYRGFAADARAAGKLVEAYELQGVATATTVRVIDGETVVTDGPFAELREQIGGYFVLDCDSIDEAVALATRLPAAEYGAIEVRPGVEGS